MANIITNSDIFQYVGAAADVQTDEATKITNLITREQSNLENMLGRKIQATAFTNILFQHNLNCRIFEEKLFLSGIYRDIYSISSITETGTTLTASTGYSDGGDYYLDTVKGIIIRINSYWSKEQLAIKASGNLGIGGGTTQDDIKQILIEMVAAKSGLWKKNVETEDGTIETIVTNISKDTEKMIKRYMLRDW